MIELKREQGEYSKTFAEGNKRTLQVGGVTQQDIDRLLAGRKIVDDYRSVSASYREKATISADSKLSADIAVAKEKYIEREAATKKMYEELIASYAEFEKFNAALILEEYKEMVDITFSGCKGCPTVNCVTRFGESTCGNKADTRVNDDIYKFFLKENQRSKEGTKTNFGDIERTCPEGYGFWWKRNRDERFDLGWK